MTGFVLSPRAQADLDEIWDYTAERWGDAQAEIYVRDIWQAVRSVSADHRKGRACDEIRKGYFKFQVGSHVMFFRLMGVDIDIVRILHSRMDPGRHL